jgi:Domain of unknown function DUF1828
MIEEIKSLVKKYGEWLEDKTVLREIPGGYVEITTPFLDRHNDYIQIYVKKESGNYLLTDGGYTIQDLELSGLPLDSQKRQNLLKMTLAGFGVEKKDQDELVVRATWNDFPLRKNNLIQAIFAVNDLFYLAKPYITSIFLEDVTEWIDLNNIKYTGKN